MNDYEFGNYIYDLRKKAGLSQSELAAQLGVTNKAVSKWENGKAKPSTDTIRKLANLLGVAVETLLEKKKGRGTYADHKDRHYRRPLRR